MPNNKHRWTLAEDKFCCEQYIKYYVINKRSIDINTFAEILQQDLPDIKLQSLRMKAQNIKQIVIELGLNDSLSTIPLENYSKQNKKAMEEVLNEMGIQ